MKILLTGFLRPSDLVNYLDDMDVTSANKVSQRMNPGVPLSDLTSSLLDLGHEITVLTSTNFVNRNQTLTGKNLKIVLLSRSKSTRMRSLVFFLPDFFKAFRFIKSEEFDLIHAHWATEITLATLFANRNTVVTFHDNPWLIFMKNRKFSNFSRAVVFIGVLILSRNRVVVSESLRSEFPFKVQSKSFTCIPNSVNFSGSICLPFNAEVRKSHKKFLMVAGHEKYKNRSVLLQSLMLLTNIDPIEVVIVSSGEQPSEEFISDKVKLRLTGSLTRSQIFEEIRQAHCIVHLSQIESFSLITAEARVLGIPMIIGKQSAAVIHTAGPSAFQIDGNKKSEVAIAISKFANLPTLATDLQDSTLNFRDNLFSHSIHLESYLSLYEGLRK
jgi:glycosyltransferase involved in cell wall biosynthesis